MRALVAYLLLWTAFLVGAGTLHAQEGLPVITSHSQLNFAVYRGDRIAMSVAATGENMEIKWVRSGGTFCRELTCEIDTSDWGLGSHRVTVVVFNGRGSLFLRYNIRILTVPPGYKPGLVTPPVVEGAERIESVSDDDFVVATTRGRGFSSHNKKVQVVGPIARTIEWRERLKTQPASRLEFSAKGKEIHQLLSSSNAALAATEDGRRVIVLREGTLRSRQLSATDPEWSVISGNWLQVDGDSKADFFVRRLEGKKDEFMVGVFRGAARVTAKKTGKQESGALRYEVTLLPGEAAVFTKKLRETPQKLLGDPKIFAEVFSESSEQYITPAYGKEDFASAPLVLGAKLEDAQKNSDTVARDALNNLDFVVALESLQQRLVKASKDKDAPLMAAEAYIGLLQLQDAKAMTARARRAAPKDPNAHFLDAVIHLIERNWSECLAAIDRANDRDFANASLMAYYRGRCELGAGNPVAARSALSEATWAAADPAVAKSAQEMVDALDEDRWLVLSGGIGVGFDNNVFRLAKDSTLMEDVGARESWFTDAYGKVELYPFRSSGGHAQVSFTGGRKDYTNKSLKEFTLLMQKIAAELQLNSGGEQGKNFYFNGGVSLQMLGVGEKRNIDTLESAVRLGAPVWWGLELYHRNLVNSDPFPLWDDRIDAKRGEVVALSDRSSKDRHIGLSLKPIAAGMSGYGLGLRIEDVQANYGAELTRIENYKDMYIGLLNSYRFGPRNQVSFDLARTARTFTETGADRADTFLVMTGGWDLMWTASIRQGFSVMYEKADSSVSDHTFSRQVLRLDFSTSF